MGLFLANKILKDKNTKYFSARDEDFRKYVCPNRGEFTPARGWGWKGP